MNTRFSGWLGSVDSKKVIAMKKKQFGKYKKYVQLENYSDHDRLIERNAEAAL